MIYCHIKLCFNEIGNNYASFNHICSEIPAHIQFERSIQELEIYSVHDVPLKFGLKNDKNGGYLNHLATQRMNQWLQRWG